MNLLLFIGTLYAIEPKEIIESAVERQQIENSIQTIRMTLVSKSGATKSRMFTMKLRRDSDALRSYTRFSEPSDIRGTQIVFIDRPNKKDPQLIYLPALKRVQRIVGRAQNGSFMGSDFSFADLEQSLSGEETHTLEHEDAEWWTIRSTDPNHKNYLYWSTKISKKDQIPYQVDYYAKNNTLLKRLTVENTREQDGRVIPIKTRMENHKKGTQTILEITEIRLNVPPEELPLDMFSPAYMEEND
ncbi:MAG: outer membrane lipoprotein-sorting protein [Myxococcota bacterium]|nr:outer membrane lipoprotein-sorting protein [Myxococcota bacterium]